MNAVEMITPEPKYFANIIAHSGIFIRGWSLPMTGNNAPIVSKSISGFLSFPYFFLSPLGNYQGAQNKPNIDPTKITKTAEILSPILPSYSFPPPHFGTDPSASATWRKVKLANSIAAVTIVSLSDRGRKAWFGFVSLSPLEHFGSSSETG